MVTLINFSGNPARVATLIDFGENSARVATLIDFRTLLDQGRDPNAFSFHRVRVGTLEDFGLASNRRTLTKSSSERGPPHGWTQTDQC